MREAKDIAIGRTKVCRERKVTPLRPLALSVVDIVF